MPFKTTYLDSVKLVHHLLLYQRFKLNAKRIKYEKGIAKNTPTNASRNYVPTSSTYKYALPKNTKVTGFEGW